MNSNVNFESILNQIGSSVGMRLEDLCFAVFTKDFDFLFSFFAFEDENVLGLLVTDSEGLEKLHVIMKSEIVYFRLHYRDELEPLFGDGDIEVSKKVNIYE